MRHPALHLSGFVALDGISRWRCEDDCFDICTPHALSQLSGYAKYCLASDGPVYFRGQSINYKEMRPSLFRGVKTINSADKRVKISRDYIKYIYADQKFISNTPKHSCEPLLQHYGLKTRWIDLVDNIWSALWFACHTAVSVGNHGRFVNYEVSAEEYSYIFLFQPGNVKKHEGSGCHTTDKHMRVVDLRVAAPSLYLRPHSQHGLLAMRTDMSTGCGMDYCDRVVLVLRIRTGDALGWLGQSALVLDRFMFPAPKYDQGYRLFLENEMTPPGVMGAITHVGA